MVPLVITIIILLILATVIINLIINNEILYKAKSAVDKYSNEEVKGKIGLIVQEMQMHQALNEENEEEALRSIFQSYDSNATVTKLNSVYEVTYMGKKFLLGSDLEYIPLVEPKNVGDWEYSNDGTIKKYIGTRKDVTIPNYINGIRMKKIGSRIFSQNAAIKRLTISNGIEEIAYLAFQYGLGELEGDIIIPDTIIEIPAGAFANCPANGTLKLGKSIKTIGNRAFRNCSNLVGDLILPDSIEEIGWQSFFGVNLLNGNLYIGNNIKIINSEAFLGLGDLKGDLVIGKSAETISVSAFKNCNSINSITFLKNDTVINSVPPNAIIKGYIGSTAQQYANDNRKTFVEISE